MAMADLSILRVVLGLGKRVFQTTANDPFAEGVVLIDPATGAAYNGATISPGSGTSAVTRVAASASSTVLIAANAARTGLIIHNESGSANLKVLMFPGVASATNYSVELASTGTLILQRGDYTGEIRGIWASATGAAQITEIT